MTELKTLKDFEVEFNDFCTHKPKVEGCCCSSRGMVSIDELKAEAIKWVKQFIKEGSDEINQNSILWIKHFFNLTESDLKELGI